MKLVALAKALDNFLYRVEKEKPPDWEKLHRIADAQITPMIAAFLAAIAEVQGSITLSEVEDALSRGDLSVAEEAINWAILGTEMLAIRTIIQGVVQEAGKATAASLGEQVGVKISFDLLNTKSVDWIQQYTGNLITQITEESKLAIRAVILDAFQNGGHPYESARRIRQYIGLTERDARAVLNYWKRLAADGTRSDKQLADMEEAYAKRLLRRRAENIARTETIMASNAGQQQLWNQAAEQGIIVKDKMYKKWIVTPDDRLCKVCAGMKGEKVPLDGVFSGGVLHPPRHPQCRCAMGLVEVS